MPAWRKLPNILTMVRIVIVPFLVLLFYIPGQTANWIALGLFLAACLTDFLDGVVARKRNEVSGFGGFLDPVADKILVCTVLVMLAAFGHFSELSAIPAVVIMAREILISNVREFTVEMDKMNLPVSQLSRWKTAFQMLALSLLIISPILGFAGQIVGEASLWIAGVLTFVTGYEYVRFSLTKMDDALKD